MAKKAIIKKQSDEIDGFIKITDDNIKDLFNYNTLFVIFTLNGNKNEIVNQFKFRQRFIKGNNYSYNYLLGDEIKNSSIEIKTTELEEDYFQHISDLKKIIKEYIKKGTIYGKII